MIVFFPWVLSGVERDAGAGAVGVEGDMFRGAVPGEIVVRFRGGGGLRPQAVMAPWEGEMRFLGRRGGVIPRVQVQGGGRVVPGFLDDVAVVKLGPDEDVEAVLERLRGHPEVVYAEPNYRLSITESPGLHPNDFEFYKMWGMENTGQHGGVVGADIQVKKAWEIGTGHRGVVVAVIDTGIDYFHPDLAANMWVNPGEIGGTGLDNDGNGYVDDVHGYDFVSRDSDPMDDQNHGTHVAGTIGAMGNNGIGVAGVCWEVSLMAVKSFDENGNGSIASVVEGIRYALENGAQIINASWGNSEKSRALEEAVRAAVEAGVLFVAAAGNDQSGELFYPAAYEGVLTVAATDAKDKRAAFSNYGSAVDLAAPGWNIISTAPNNRYEALSGTSMAAPHASGVAALVMAKRPDFTAEEVGNLLRNTADVIVTDHPIGTGRLNAYRAIREETPLPVARLNLPESIHGVVDILGTAKGREFVSYTLEYGKGKEPGEWTLLHTGKSVVENGVLFGKFYTPILEEGVYTFRLTARNARGATGRDRGSVAVRNVRISSPLNNDVFRAGDKLKITGSVYGQDRIYRIEYGEGDKPAVWMEGGIELRGGGREEVLDSELATWDTSMVAPDAFYTLKLTAKNPRGTTAEHRVQVIYLDGQLKPGWPRTFSVSGEGSADDWRRVQVADLNGDGFQELMVVEPGNSEGKLPRLLVFQHDGELAWSRELAGGAPYVDVPVAGDATNDGFMEIFVDTGSYLSAFRHDGTPLAGNWPYKLEATRLGKVLADLNRDGRLELIGYSQNSVERGDEHFRQLLVINAQGNLMQKWDIASCSSKGTAADIYPAVANLDDDPDLEIVAVTSCRSLGAFSLKEPGHPIWTAYTEGELVSSPVIGDINRSGSNEIIIGAQAVKKSGARGGLHVFDHRGEALPGWPVLLQESFSHAPALGDFTGDGNLEICIASAGQRIHLVHHYGFEANGWPAGPMFDSVLKSGPVIGDLTGNGRLDVAAPSPGILMHAFRGDYSYLGGVKAWNQAGFLIDLNRHEKLRGLFFESDGTGTGPAVLTDIDNDGVLDLVIVSSQDAAYSTTGDAPARKSRSTIYVWNMDAPYEPERFPWPMFGRDPRHTGFYAPPEWINQAPVVLEFSDQTVPPGADFFPIELDRYVEDEDHAPSEIFWRVRGNRDLEVIIDANRVARITPPGPEWTGEERIEFVARDPEGLEGRGWVVFSVRAGYRPPVAVEDRATLLEDAFVEIDALANDLHPDGSPLFISHFSRPAFGRVERTDQGKLLYLPDEDYFGTDSFTYTISDGSGGMAMGTVYLEVLPVNDPPTAVTDRVITWEDTPVEIAPLANDYDVDGEAISLISFGQPEHGVVEEKPGDVFLYAPRQDYYGMDGFQYIISDPHGLTSTGRVEILVKPVNDAPVAHDLSFTINRNTAQSIVYKATDVDGDTLTYRIIKEPEHGELWNYPTVATYYPLKHFSGKDSFSYVANDGQLDSNEATVSFVILDLNNPPDAISQTIITKPMQPVEITLEAGDADDDPVTFQIVKQPLNGIVEGEPPAVIYHPGAGFLGFDEFLFVASDGASQSAETKISIEVTDENTAPEAKNMQVETRMDQALTLALKATDRESDPLTYQIVSAPTQGALEGEGPEMVYTPKSGFIGSDRFTFRAHDGELESEEANVSIAVKPLNDPPVAGDQSISLNNHEPAVIFLAVSDPNGDALKTAILKGPKNGMLAGSGTVFTYTPRPGFLGNDQFTYKSWDGHAYSNVGKVTVSVVPRPQVHMLQFDSIQPLSDGRVSLILKGPAGALVEVQGSTDLEEWISVERKNLIGGMSQFTDAASAELPRRFYRAIVIAR